MLLGSLFGCPLKVDNATFIGSRPALMRVLVELDITKKYPKKVWLGPDKLGYIQSVEIEAFPPFCGQCKALGHGKGECRSISSVPMNGLANSNIPIKNVCDGTGVVENVVVDGNVDVASSNPLCPVTSLIGVGNGVVSTLGVEAAEAGVHSSVVGLVGPSLVAYVVRPPADPVAPEAVALVPENIDVCKVISDNPEPEVCLDPPTVLEGAIVLAGCSIIVSPTVIEKSPIGFVSGCNRVEELEGHCVVNQVVDVGPSELGVTAKSSLVNDLDSPMGAFLPTNLVDVPVSLISNVAMHANLASKWKDCPVDHSDWLEVSSLSGEEEGKSSAKSTDNLHKFYSLQVGHIVENTYSLGGGKCLHRKSK
ncbi:hypothetical protein IEQ34_026934 [Dendrobium chrysotoxum]|uniref:Uncharacterized protein n=1 Tax=Dendrobium chrysotoxum TaxID=161865 RepID=A0AAV7FI61_DENCH|nr:hypothetical protein IEQ34_026934 [Dendrobium chrysotoxum]